MNLNTIRDLLKKAVQPKKLNYTLLHDDTKRTDPKGKGYTIVCESVAKLPISKKEIMDLSDEQAKLLETILKYRKFEKKIKGYEALMITNNDN